ncbi:MAG: hypothetical protein DCF17_05230 [Shackletoniella antarctica]|jgi:hypothetical protein|uniref:Iron-containing redox enzyme family protein n=1 Tax=Shackletoniella antarctica TaxID=268115 RepID=A0A2W4WPZ9_9CYAN|nr:MAG: hypothetical protein DCF17_05230 [Shackletoniella antarctica]
MLSVTHDSITKHFESIESHKAIIHPLFEWLNEQSIDRFSDAILFDIYRTNYFTRTQGITSAISEILKAAIEESDSLTIALVGMNIFEETGEGDSKNTHLMMLQDSHNQHGEFIFNLAPIPIKLARHNDHTLNHTLKSFRNFPENRMHLYSNTSYLFKLGVMLADETAAVPMIEGFYKAFFKPYEKLYTKKDFQSMSQYFSSHLSGVEQRHGSDILQAVDNNFKSISDLDEVMYGIESFFRIQSDIWDDLLLALLTAKRG